MHYEGVSLGALKAELEQPEEKITARLVVSLFFFHTRRCEFLWEPSEVIHHLLLRDAPRARTTADG